MTGPFERHGIAHLSVSSLALYRNEPALWCLRYLFGVKDEVGAAAWRGQAVEAGVDLALMTGCPDAESIAFAVEDFEKRAHGDLAEDIQKERAIVPDLVRQAVAAMKPYGIPNARQLKIEHWLDGIEIPLLGFIDYAFESGDLDLKTTTRLPSEPRPDHVVQVTSYGAARGRKQTLLYVTPKKSQAFDTFDAEAALYTLNRSARALRAMLSRCETKERAADLFTPNFDSFYWTPATKNAALGVFQ